MKNDFLSGMLHRHEFSVTTHVFERETGVARHALVIVRRGSIPDTALFNAAW